MWIDTHCHLDAHEFGGESLAVAGRAGRGRGVDDRDSGGRTRQLRAVAELAPQAPNASYALGIHPIDVRNAGEDDLARCARRSKRRWTIRASWPSAKSASITSFRCCANQRCAKSRSFLPRAAAHRARLRTAGADARAPFAGPGARACPPDSSGGQDRPCVQWQLPAGPDLFKLGFRLGFGGAMTFTRALQIRRLAGTFPLDAIVLETDAPDISPAWIHPARNSPEQLPAIGAALAELRGIAPEVVRSATMASAIRALPRLAAILRAAS